MNTDMPYGITSNVWPGLAKLVEEIGEVSELLGKIMGAGGSVIHYWACPVCEGEGCENCHGEGVVGHGDLTDAIHEELGDLRSAIDFFTEYNPEHLDRKRIDRRYRMKKARFKRWRETGVF